VKGPVREEDDTTNDDRARLRRLILGGLPPEEREALEERVLAEPALLETASEVEAEIADDHAAGRLTDHDRDAWRARVAASPRLRERSDFAMALLPATTAHVRSTRMRRPVPLALAATLLLVLAGAAVAVLVRSRPPARIAAAPTPSLTPLAASPSPVARAPRFVVLALGLGTVRSAAAVPAATVPPDVDEVHLQAGLESVEGYRVLRAVVDADGGPRVFVRDDLEAPSGPAPVVLEVAVPAERLPPGAYVLTVEGRSAEGRWDTLALREFRTSPPSAIRPPG
jgi:hypothetical protein